MKHLWVGLIALLLCAAAGQQQKLTTHVSARVEAVARAICRARGLDPDHQGPPFPAGPLWEYYVGEATLFVDEYDTLMRFMGPDELVPLVPQK
jgi:hypothetical protein